MLLCMHVCIQTLIYIYNYNVVLFVCMCYVCDCVCAVWSATSTAANLGTSQLNRSGRPKTKRRCDTSTDGLALGRVPSNEHVGDQPN